MRQHGQQEGPLRVDDAAVAGVLFDRAVFVRHLVVAAVEVEEGRGPRLLHVIEEQRVFVRVVVERAQRADHIARRERALVILLGQLLLGDAAVDGEGAERVCGVRRDVIFQHARDDVARIDDQVAQVPLETVAADPLVERELPRRDLVEIEHREREFVGAAGVEEQIGVEVPLLPALEIDPADGDVRVVEMLGGEIAFHHLAQALAREIALIAELLRRPDAVRRLRAAGGQQRQTQQQPQQGGRGAAYAVFLRISHVVSRKGGPPSDKAREDRSFLRIKNLRCRWCGGAARRRGCSTRP